MKFFVLSFSLTIVLYTSGQSHQGDHFPGKMHSVAIGMNLPVGDFSSTHIIGASAEYSWTHHRFGRFIITKKKLGFIANAGLAYYFGKKETVSGYSYDYPGYLFIDMMGGAIINYGKKTNIDLTAGPAIGFYNGDSKFNFSARLEGTYYIKQRIGISPAVIMMKEHGVNVLWSAMIKGSWLF